MNIYDPSIDPMKLSVEDKIELVKKTNGLASELLRGLKIKTKKTLRFTGCTGLINLPEGLEVKGSLSLVGCINLKSLPIGLKIGGYFDLTNCTNLENLPMGLEVEGCLDLTNCINIKSLPKDLKAGWIRVLGCTGLEGSAVRWAIAAGTIRVKKDEI